MSQADFIASALDAAKPAPSTMTGARGEPLGKRFDVYRNNIAVGLTEALEVGFPVIRKLVGDEFFKAMAGVYLRQHPPSSPIMSQYGDKIPGFLRNFEPVAHLPYLPDVARLEVLIRRSYHAADAEQLRDLGDLAVIDLATTTLEFAPSVSQFASDFPVYDIWMANMKGASMPKVATAQSVLISRPAFDPILTALDTDEAEMTRDLRQGHTLGTLLGHPAAMKLTTLLPKLAVAGALTAVKTGGTNA